MASCTFRAPILEGILATIRRLDTMASSVLMDFAAGMARLRRTAQAYGAVDT